MRVVALLITVFLAFPAPYSAQTHESSAADVAHLTAAFKLLQLQLKQATETAEHFSALLSTLERPGSADVKHEHKATKSKAYAAFDTDKADTLSPKAQQADAPRQLAQGIRRACHRPVSNHRQTQANRSLLTAVASSSIAKHEPHAFSRTLAQRVTNWADDFSMLSAIKADDTVTAMAVITFPPGGLQNQFLILGDQAGSLYGFNTRGQIAMEHAAGK